ncbi:hypothetical protein FQZ97_1022380 [compost metagenome]
MTKQWQLSDSKKVTLFHRIFKRQFTGTSALLKMVLTAFLMLLSFTPLNWKIMSRVLSGHEKGPSWEKIGHSSYLGLCSSVVRVCRRTTSNPCSGSKKRLNRETL